MHSQNDVTASAHDDASVRTMVVRGTKLHYRVEGRGPTLVLLHGLFSTLRCWDGWVRELAQNYRVVRLDLPGFGESERARSDDYTPEHVLELMEDVRTQLELDHFHLAGSCLGGFVAWYYAAHHPERVDKLILVSPIGPSGRLRSSASLLSLPMAGGVLGAFAPPPVIAKLVRAAFGKVDAEHAQVRSDLGARTQRRTVVRAARQLRKNGVGRELLLQLGRVRAPTLLMWGAQDRVLPASDLQLWRAFMPNAELRLYEEAGHMLMAEQPQQSAADARAFLADGTSEGTPEPSGEHVVPAALARGA